jgi:hypothetical protein
MPIEKTFITIICWNLIAWLFWMSHRLFNRSRLEHRRLAEEKKQAANESEP